MDIFEFRDLAHKQVDAFVEYWLEENTKSSSDYPLSLPDDNEGLWWEFLVTHGPPQEEEKK